jgi:hypothetical protein
MPGCSPSTETMCAKSCRKATTCMTAGWAPSHKILKSQRKRHSPIRGTIRTLARRTPITTQRGSSTAPGSGGHRRGWVRPEGDALQQWGETYRTAFTTVSPPVQNKHGPLRERVVQDAEESTAATAPSAWQPFRAAPANNTEENTFL